MTNEKPIPSETVHELHARMKGENGDFFLLDVRERHEHDIAKLDHHAHIPMGEVLFRLDELPKDKTILVLCRSGSRSSTVTELLIVEGYDAKNVDGGILAWSDEIDQTVQKY